MPPGRPPKRPGDGMDSPLDAPSSANKPKAPRLERGPEDFSSVVKSKLSSYPRTGQACDRCKVRKIRCDALPDGCTHCTQQNLECYVTDRVSGRTERRGYLQQLEREKKSLLGHVRDLEKLLGDKGVQVRSWQASSACTPGTPFDAEHGDPSWSKDPSAQFGSLWTRDSTKPEHPQSSSGASSGLDASQDVGAEAVGGHLDVAKDCSPLSSINGTQLSILGTTIDITSFEAPDMDGPPAGTPLYAPLYNKSLQSFFNSLAKVNPPVDVPLPPREEAFSYSEWFFVLVGAFVPVLHKPTYMKLLARIYDDETFRPTNAELVIVHMVIAMMYYQFGCRNSEEPKRRAHLNDLSNKHYHWSIDKTWNLAGDRSLTSTQGLILMATHCRGFPKPGPAWFIASLAWNRVIESNLHHPYLKDDEPTGLENEMRKRIFWSLFQVVIMLFGRLGKPMPIRAEDIDVGFPVCVPDECLTEDGITDPGRIGECQWQVGFAGFKLSYLFMDMWNNVHPARQDPSKYVEAVRRIEQKFRAYQRELPDELKPDKRRPSASSVQATYLEASNHEFLLCLRHPSRCATGDPAVLAENYRICEEAARKLLRVASDLAKLQSLDTNWYQMAVYVAAIFTLLASRWNRRAETTPAELADLKEHMGMGLSVVSEILKYIGASDARVMSQITSVIDRTVASIEQEMMNSRRSSRTSTPQQLPSRPSKHDEYGHHHASSSRRGRTPRSASGTPVPMTADQISVPRLGGGGGGGGGVAPGAYYNSPLTHINTAYSQMGYPELGGTPTTSAAAGSPYDGAHHHQHHQQQYLYATSAAAVAAATAQMVHSGTPSGSSPQAAAAAASQQQHNQPMAGYGAHHHQGSWMGVGGGGGSPWHEWTNAMVDPPAANQDRYSANALLTLGGGRQRGPGDAAGGAGETAGPQSGQWPMMVFHPPNVSGA